MFVALVTSSFQIVTDTFQICHEVPRLLKPNDRLRSPTHRIDNRIIQLSFNDINTYQSSHSHKVPTT
jgi:hypothetical protein